MPIKSKKTKLNLSGNELNKHIEIKKFEMERSNNIAAMGKDHEMKNLGIMFEYMTSIYKYTYNFSWMGRPIIQFPQDIIALQELIWDVKPDLIIETGIAHGGSLIFSASMLSLIEYCEAIAEGTSINPSNIRHKVVGIDIDIRCHNRQAIENHPLSHRIEMIEGSSTSPEVINKVRTIAEKFNTVFVILDSNHTHDHVLAELKAYSPFIRKGSYCVVCDTAIEDMPENLFKEKPWGKGNNPKTAVWEFLRTHPEFEIDKNIQNKLLITVAPDGYLKRVK